MLHVHYTVHKTKYVDKFHRLSTRAFLESRGINSETLRADFLVIFS